MLYQATRGRRAVHAVVGAALAALTTAAIAQTPPAQTPPDQTPPAQTSPGKTPPTRTPPAPQPRPGPDYWQPDWMVRELWGPGRMPKGMMTRLLRHTTYMNTGVPPDYDGARSPLAPGPETTARGAKIYAAQCASCHGKDGLGDGDAENAVSPSPALLAFMVRRPIAIDEYLLWSIADGGTQFQSAMPGFRDTLSRDEIWAVIAYMRAGFPQIATDEKK